MVVAPNRRAGGTLVSAFCLLFLSILINYIDRVNLSVAAPLLKDELRISASQLGVLFAAFFWTYSTAQIISGWIIDRYDVNWVLAAAFVLWSLATTATGLIHGFAMLIAVRILLGAAESVAFPSYSKIIALHVPRHRQCRHHGGHERRAGSRVIRLRHIDGALRMATRVHCARPSQSHLGCTLAALDAEDPDCRTACDCHHISREHLSAAVLLGRVDWAFLHRLPVVFHSPLAAVISGR